MDYFKKFDKVNIPIFVCDRDWMILSRNRACKKYSATPRASSRLDRCFIDKEHTNFPEENGGFEFIGCFLGEHYRTAMCFEYRSNAIVLFPTLFEFDLLFGDVVGENKKELTDAFREVLDVIVERDVPNEDKYNVLGKLRNYIFNCIDNYVALSLYDMDRRVVGTAKQIYDFFCKTVIKTVNKAGYRVEYNLEKLLDIGDNTYIDTSYFIMALSGLLMFCLSVSSDKMAYVEAEHLGQGIRTTVFFTREKGDLCERSGENLHDFMYLNPTEYLNFLPLEQMCESLGWELDYYLDSSQEKLNISVGFDMVIDNKTVFRSSGDRIQLHPEDVISKVVEYIFGIVA